MSKSLSVYSNFFRVKMDSIIYKYNLVLSDGNI